jgi:Fe-S-cluster containining protein
MKYKTFEIKAISIERDLPESTVECGECSQCCVALSPYLTAEEFASGHYVYTFVTSHTGQPTIAIPRGERGCFYLHDGKCSIYSKRPKACRQFDCRQGHYPPFRDLAMSKFGEYNEN